VIVGIFAIAARGMGWINITAVSPRARFIKSFFLFVARFNILFDGGERRLRFACYLKQVWITIVVIAPGSVL